MMRRQQQQQMAGERCLTGHGLMHACLCFVNMIGTRNMHSVRWLHFHARGGQLAAARLRRTAPHAMPDGRRGASKGEARRFRVTD